MKALTFRPLRPYAVIAALALTACSGQDEGPTIVQPGAPGQSAQALNSDEVPRPEGQEHTDADVQFIHRMIPHHAQALRMTSLVAERTMREDIPLFAERIEISQEDEIALMQDWLEARGEEVPSASQAHDHGDLMPGMLTGDQISQLEEASGAAFDRLFLELMIQHHEGALIMVEELRDSDGGQEPEIFQLATHIDADQRIEIDRMQGLLAEMEGGTPE